MVVQSVVFPKKAFTMKEAKKWLTKHNYRTSFYGKEADVTENTYRFRQAAPSNLSNYYTKTLPNEVQLVLGQ
jgi:glycyl-tRNA synthetase (class II)